MKMFLKISVVCILVSYYVVTITHCWDVAVTSGKEIAFLFANGTLEGNIDETIRMTTTTTTERANHVRFTELTALTFDSVRHRLFASDTGLASALSPETSGSTLYSIHLARGEHDRQVIRPVVLQVEDNSIEGIAFDAVTETLFWTSSNFKRIMFIKISGDAVNLPQQMFEFEEEIPQGIAVDSCGRSLFWTNINHRKPSIEKSTLNGEDREVIISEYLFIPTGITVDQTQRKIFWTDDSEGIYYRIESANLDGSERRTIVHEGHQQPFGIAVGVDSIFWTDWISNGVWSVPKTNQEVEPKLVYKFHGETPMGITAKNYQFISVAECASIAQAVHTFNESTTEMYESYTDQMERSGGPSNNKFKSAITCENNGTLYVTVSGENRCNCLPGFEGAFCELPLCHNYCVHGHCTVSLSGYPQCNCSFGYAGQRCERDVCDSYCLNGGRCRLNEHSQIAEPVCSCEEDFTGQRCEQRSDPDEKCRVFCEQGEVITHLRGKLQPICRCSDYDSNSSIAHSLAISSAAITPEGSFTDRMRDPLVIALAATCLILAPLSMALLTVICRMRKRPRIKKRIIVNKNVTPLTCRPLPAQEQCEITIENCCNMNICETPCFEPPQYRSGRSNRMDDKKLLLENLENGDDIY